MVVTSGTQRSELHVTPAPAWYEVPLDGEPFDVLNNVGSVVLTDGHGADRGYLERDDGQFDEVEEVFAWCGAAVLLSREYLETVGLFEDRYFLYYEDFDLSWRGRAEGWRYLYVPASVVRHVHSASSVEGSRLFQHYDERNRLLTLTRNAPPALAVREAVRHPADHGLLRPPRHPRPPGPPPAPVGRDRAPADAGLRGLRAHAAGGAGRSPAAGDTGPADRRGAVEVDGAALTG